MSLQEAKIPNPADIQSAAENQFIDMLCRMIDVDEMHWILDSIDVSKEVLADEFEVLLRDTNFGDIEMSDEE